MPPYLMMVAKNKKRKDEGQAIFEMIVFLPLLIVFFIALVVVSNAINGSINQQKTTRGYFYNTIHNDSSLLNRSTLASYQSDGAQRAGMLGIGWAERLEGNVPVAPCYKMISFGGKSDEKLDEACSPGEIKDTRTHFIRVKTAYGLCTESYILSSGFFYRASTIPSNGMMAASLNSCNISRD